VISVGIAPAESLLSLWTGDEKFSPSRFGVTNHNDKKKKKKKKVVRETIRLIALYNY